MAFPARLEPVMLWRDPVRLEPLGLQHEAGLAAAAADGELWKLRITSVPAPHETRAYIETALAAREAGHRFAFVVLDAITGEVIGSSSYHDIVPALDRLEIGYTWYALSRQRSAVNTTAKWLLMSHAFETLGAQLVGWRTDNYNFASQRAIERLGARKDGVLRHHALRRDGTVRDTVMYSLAAGEWPEVKAHLEYQLTKPR
ncbi:GNAT family N-acetyltransferase [Aquincola sp. S2]|uniref:GNAT family N-acetyltransferase n=1 Tax=Pseudaquabacterium terrae TaxID=2732868 RepID=A0ABX2EHL2_9BURK|nr:GNAT family protein [Aquabacterium terrae]NRF68077.1 GNAT family N-acetyltransferase [Aquabacterium terrae]